MYANKTMNEPAAHKSQWETSEVVFGIPLLISIGMHFIVPLPFAHGIVRFAFIPFGSILAAVGAGFIVLARRELRQQGQPTDPGKPTSKVVKSGVFSISRNPLYFGIVMMFIGIAMVFNLLWILLLLVLSFIICHYVLIFPEERYLSTRFGEEYKIYAASVNRWFGRN